MSNPADDELELRKKVTRVASRLQVRSLKGWKADIDDIDEQFNQPEASKE